MSLPMSSPTHSFILPRSDYYNYLCILPVHWKKIITYFTNSKYCLILFFKEHKCYSLRIIYNLLFHCYFLRALHVYVCLHLIIPFNCRMVFHCMIYITFHLSILQLMDIRVLWFFLLIVYVFFCTCEPL